jgi:myosin-5
VWQSGGERNYHIFHQLLATGDKEKQTLKLCKAVSEYRYTKNAIAAASIEGVSDKDNFTKIKGAMKTLGVEPLAQAFLYRLLSGLLNLGQVSFVDAGDSERSEVNPDTSADLVLASSLLGIEPDMLSLTLTSRQLITRNGASVTRVPMNKAAALNGLDATAKNLFVKVFDWLVEKINGTINADPKEVETHIGLLDIFGFESFQHNSFEQLCINYTNETLQQKFCQDVFKSVQSEYEAEGIPLNSVAFADNQPVLDMIESRMGILSLLNEECLRPQGSDKSFASKITQQFVTKDSPMKRDRKSDMCFTIVHYAESVTYDAEGWCDKNKDTLIEDMVKQLEKSTSSFVKQLFAPKPAIVAQVAAKKEGGRRGGAQRRGSTLAVNTVALQFRNQLKTLMTTIRTTNVQYVRCIKPNPNKSPTEYDPKMVVEQLRSAGVVDSIRISRAAYPNRMLSADFKLRFKVLASSEAKSHETLIAALVKKYCSKMTVKDDRYYEFGKTKIFFVKGVLELFEDARLEKLSMVRTLY